MKRLYFSTRYKKDFKRYKNKPQKLEKLLKVLWMLKNGEPLPPELRSHFLQGKYNNCMECHIESDFLLIWFDKEREVIELLRLGTHSELFKE